MKFFEELKRRNVINATMAYVVHGLGAAGSDDPPCRRPSGMDHLWVYDVTPEGLKKTEDLPYDPNATATNNKAPGRADTGSW